MNKFTLFFLDKRIEALYQTQSLVQIRMNHFNILTKGQVASFFFRCLAFLLNSDLSKFYPNFVMLIFFVLIQIFLARKNLSLRILSVLTNYMLTLFFYLFDEETDVAVANLKGSNQMAACFLITMGNEFPEAFVQIISLVFLKSYFVIFQSKTLSLYPITSLILVSSFYLFFHYKYNEAMRAQFMLIQKDRQWENILKQLIDKECYVMLNFNEATFQFENLIANNFKNQFENKIQISNFLKEAQYQKQSLYDYIYFQMKNYQKTRMDVFKNEIYVRHQRDLIKLHFSIFFANQPTILIIFHKPKLRICNKKKILDNQVVLQYLIKLLQCLRKQYKYNKSYIDFMKKVHLVNIYQNLKCSWEQKVEELNVLNLIQKQAKYFPNLNVLINLDHQIILTTNQDILNLILFKLFQSTLNSQIKLRYSFFEETIQINFSGKFDNKLFLSFFNHHKEYLIRFLQINYATNYSIAISIEKRPLIPFTGIEKNYC